MDKVYLDPSSPAYLAGINAVYREAKKRDPSVTQKDVKEYLANQDVHSLHKPPRRRFKRNKIVALGLHSDWQIDLMDLEPLKKYNNGMAYIIMVVDSFSRYIFAVPIKTKQPQTVLKGFKKVLKSSPSVPWHLTADRGKEWSGAFKKFMDDKGIKFYYATSPDVKASQAEIQI